MARTYTAGIVTAYGAAKEAGYTGTYEEFCEQQAGFAGNAAQVADDRAAVETIKNTFETVTVPAAVQTVQTEGATQAAAVTAKGTEQVGVVNAAGDAQTGRVQMAGAEEVQDIETAGTTQVGAVNTAGATQVNAVNTAGATQLSAVNAAGTTQTGNVNDAGATQIAAIEAKGEETRESIPEDYTTLSNDVDDLKSSITTLAEAQKLSWFNRTVSGTVMKQINVSIPAGTYNLKVDSVTSSDTQYTTSRITFFGSGGTSKSTDIDRTNGRNASITVSFDVTSIAFYGAHNYSDSAGVTFSYNNVEIVSDTVLDGRLNSLETGLSELGDKVHLVVSPISVTETAGYYSESGNIQSASTAYKEVYTNKIPVNALQKIHWTYKPSDGIAHSLWLAYMLYDSDGNVIGKRVTAYDATATEASGYVEISKNVKYISFTYRTFGLSDAVKFESLFNEKYINAQKPFPFIHEKFYGHLLINYVDESTAFTRVIPCESIFDVQATARLGFKYIEANVQATATAGKYVVTHGISGKLGNDFETVGGDNVGNVVIAETSYDDLRTNYRYRSKYAKYRVPITSLEEFLYACKTHNMYPVLQYVDETSLKIARGIVGDNLILYGGNRSVFDGYIMEYLGLTTEAQIIQRCMTVGAPYMYCMSNPTAFTDVQLKSIISKVHEAGCYIGNAGTYDTPAENNRLMNLGFDFSASGGMVNDFGNGNIINICDSPTFDGITTNGTISNGTLHLNEGQTVTFTHDSRLLIKFIMCLNFVGTLSINYPRKAGKTDNFTFTMTSDGTQDNNFSATLVERSLSVTLTGGTGGADIRTLSFRASEC